MKKGRKKEGGAGGSASEDYRAHDEREYMSVTGMTHRRSVVLPVYEHVLEVLYAVCVSPTGARHQVAEASRLTCRDGGEGRKPSIDKMY